jgi:hypothetical protein
MINLHHYLPDQYTEDEFVMIDLDNLYKEYSRDSHTFALEKIFSLGVEHANEVFKIGMDEYNDLKARYEALLEKVSDTTLPDDSAAEQIALSQTLGMGKVFQR